MDSRGLCACVGVHVMCVCVCVCLCLCTWRECVSVHWLTSLCGSVGDCFFWNEGEGVCCLFENDRRFVHLF